MRNILCNIINPVSVDTADFLSFRVISIAEGKISSIRKLEDIGNEPYEDYSAYVAIPGLIDLHVHLSQYRMRGLYEPALLPWLNKYVFPEETLSAELSYAEAVAREFFGALAKAGTTTSIIYTAPFPQAAQAAFSTAEMVGARAMIGMTLMDQNSPSALQQTTTTALENSFRLYDAWHNKNPLLDYIFTPRFAPTCSLELMKEIGAFSRHNQAWVQTHLSENLDELKWVSELFGMQSYTEVYEKTGLLSPKSIFGHAIHLRQRELDILAGYQAKIAHCPDSNFYLKSGEFPLQSVLEAGIEFGLGSDVGAGTSLNMLYHQKMMNYRQSSKAVLPAEALYRITLGSAKLLGMHSLIGSLEPGKDADIVFLAPPAAYPVSSSTLSQLCFFGQEFQVKETLTAGRTIYPFAT